MAKRRTAIEWKHAHIQYTRHNNPVAIQVPVSVPDGPDWEARARRVGRIVAEIHLALYFTRED